MMVATAAADTGNLRFYQRLGFRFLSVDRDAFTAATGYPDVIVIDMGLGGDDRIFSGFAWNFARQPAEQKKYSLPLCSVL